MDKPVYKRVLVKLSGEAMQAKDGIIDFEMLEKVAAALKQCTDEGVQVAVVVGAGNIWRGARQGKNMNRCLADHMGMLATVINVTFIIFESSADEMRSLPAVISSPRYLWYLGSLLITAADTVGFAASCALRSNVPFTLSICSIL